LNFTTEVRNYGLAGCCVDICTNAVARSNLIRKLLSHVHYWLRTNYSSKTKYTNYACI